MGQRNHDITNDRMAMPSCDVTMDPERTVSLIIGCCQSTQSLSSKIPPATPAKSKKPRADPLVEVQLSSIIIMPPTSPKEPPQNKMSLETKT